MPGSKRPRARPQQAKTQRADEADRWGCAHRRVMVSVTTHFGTKTLGNCYFPAGRYLKCLSKRLLLQFDGPVRPGWLEPHHRSDRRVVSLASAVVRGLAAGGFRPLPLSPCWPSTLKSWIGASSSQARSRVTVKHADGATTTMTMSDRLLTWLLLSIGKSTSPWDEDRHCFRTDRPGLRGTVSANSLMLHYSRQTAR